MIWFILFISAVIRVWGINFAFPLRFGHIDESAVIFYTMRFFTGNFNPNPFFDYPTLFLYLLFFCYLVYFAVGSAFGKFDSIGSFVSYYNTNAVPFIFIGRLLTVVFSLATIYLTYLLAKKLFDKKTGLISAAILSFSFQHVLSSHYATTDITAAFVTLLSILFVWEVFTKGNLKSYLLAGLFCGLSIATKYYGGIVFLVIIIFGWKNKKYVGFSLLTAITGFFIGCPYAFIDYAGFFGRFFNRMNLIVGWGGGHSVFLSSFLTYPAILYAGLGYALLLLSLVGLIFIILKPSKQNTFLLIVIAVFLIFFGAWKNLEGRYILALYPLFAIISASIIAKIKSKIIFVAVICLILIGSLPKILKTDVLLSQKDTRIIARDWVLDNIPEKSRILRGPFCPEFPDDNYYVTIDWHDSIKSGSFPDIQRNFDYVITSSLHSDPQTFNNNLAKDGKTVYEISKESIGEFQNPTIKVWALK